MLGFILGAATVLTIGAAVICYVNGKINKEKVKEQMRLKKIKNAFVSKVDRCNNTVKMTDLESGNEIIIQGDDISYNIYESQTIYA